MSHSTLLPKDAMRPKSEAVMPTGLILEPSIRSLFFMFVYSYQLRVRRLDAVNEPIHNEQFVNSDRRPSRDLLGTVLILYRASEDRKDRLLTRLEFGEFLLSHAF